MPKSKYEISLPSLPEADIQVSYRNEQGCRMHGAFFDHYLLRQITGHRTQMTYAAETKDKSFREFIKDTTLVLGMKKYVGKRKVPSVSHNDPNHSGLLFIPGHARDSKDTVRSQHEQKLIQEARRRGQPILAVCAGSWELWEAFGGRTKSVTDHVYASMPYILSGDKTAGTVGNNVQIHRINIINDTVVAGAMKAEGAKEFPTVNSVHWEVPDEVTMPTNLLMISATAKRDDKIKHNNRQGNQMLPEEDTPEAFETKSGAPMVGIQWHPEAYLEHKNPAKISLESSRHLNLIRYMAKAGDAYHAKRMMLQEFQKKFKPVESVKRHGFFVQMNNRQKMEKEIELRKTQHEQENQKTMKRRS